MKRRSFVGSAAAGSLLANAARAQNNPELMKATEAVLAAIPLAEADPERPVYHFHPPAQWTNDPNGTLYYRGWHHLFYQLNPFAARIGNQHWGHARSRDLVNWEHLPIALWPSTELGETAIYSGGAAIAADGRPRLFYTSIGHAQPEQWMAVPEDDDLIRWKKYPGNPVVSQAMHISGPIQQWRDPFLFVDGGHTYMVCGGGTAAPRAQVQLYVAAKPDLTAWKHLGPIYQSLDREIRNFECPNLFPLDGRWVLIVAPNRPCEYWVGDLDVAHLRFTPTAHGILDAGDAYASNISVDGKGRTLLWLWGRTNTNPEKGWGGVIAMPRVILIGPDGYLCQTPAPEFETLRGEKRTFPGGKLDQPIVLDGVSTDCAEFEVEFTGGGVQGIQLRRSASGAAALDLFLQGGYLNIGAVRSFVGIAPRYKVRVFLDKRCAEVFVNDGIAAVFKWFDAGANDLGAAIYGKPQTGRGFRANTAPPEVSSIAMWPLKPARFDLTRFRPG